MCGALRDLVPFPQFKKREKHGCFSRFLNCRNGTKSHNARHLLTLLQQISHLSTRISDIEGDTFEIFNYSLSTTNNSKNMQCHVPIIANRYQSISTSLLKRLSVCIRLFVIKCDNHMGRSRTPFLRQ